MADSRLTCGAETRASPHVVLELPRLERTLLWSIRTWAAYHDAPQAIRSALQRVFVDAGIHPALEPFGQLMTVLFSGGHTLPDIRCVRCLRLGRDEYALLAMMAVVTQETEPLVLMRLRKLMSPGAARVGAVAALAMMQAIGQAGLRMGQERDIATPAVWPQSHDGHDGYRGLSDTRPY